VRKLRLANGVSAMDTHARGKRFETDGKGNSDVREPSLERSERPMIVLGIILLLIGYLVATGISSILITVGWILVVVGVVLWILGAVGRPVGGRKVWF
jgi:hypothetical protein